MQQAYQVYSEQSDVGKHMAASKKKVRWRFCFGEAVGAQEHEVVLVHSVISGKKVLSLNGNELITQSGVASFHYQFECDGHAMRVEIKDMSVAEDTYALFIDSRRFDNLPKKPLGGAPAGSGRKGSTSKRGKRRSTATESKTGAAAASATAAAAPAAQPAAAEPNFFDEAPAADATASAAAGQGFDPFQAQQRTQGGQTTQAQSNGFDAFGQSADFGAATTTNTGGGASAGGWDDGFGQTSTRPQQQKQQQATLPVPPTQQVATADPFAAAPVTTTQTQATAGFDAFGSDLPATAAPPPAASTASAGGAFGGSGKAEHIADDFAGMMFDTLQVSRQQAQQAEQQAAAQTLQAAADPYSAESSPPAPQGSTDRWGKVKDSLVNLDHLDMSNGSGGPSAASRSKPANMQRQLSLSELAAKTPPKEAPQGVMATPPSVPQQPQMQSGMQPLGGQGMGASAMGGGAPVMGGSDPFGTMATGPGMGNPNMNMMGGAPPQGGMMGGGVMPGPAGNPFASPADFNGGAGAGGMGMGAMQQPQMHAQPGGFGGGMPQGGMSQGGMSQGGMHQGGMGFGQPQGQASMMMQPGMQQQQQHQRQLPQQPQTNAFDGLDGFSSMK